MSSENRIKKWALKVSSENRIKKWALKVSSENRIKKWALKVSSENRIKKWALKVSSENRIKKWALKVGSENISQKWNLKWRMEMENNKNTSFVGVILLFLAALIWGVAFVAQSVGAEYMGPFTFNMSRSVLAGLFLIPLTFIFGEKPEKFSAESSAESSAKSSAKYSAKSSMNASDNMKADGSKRTLILGGIFCGIALFVAGNLQQLGMSYTTVGKGGFITTMYIILVPIASIFLHKKAGVKVWISVLIAIVGLYLLCITDEFGIEKGDVFVFLSAIAYTCHILVIDYFSPKVDGIKMSCIQFWVMSALSAVCMLIFENPSWDAILSAWLPICYAGIGSSGLGYTFQILGQKKVESTVASLVMSLESVVSVIAGWIILGEAMSSREIGGCVLVFAAVILAQIPGKKGK